MQAWGWQQGPPGPTAQAADFQMQLEPGAAPAAAPLQLEELNELQGRALRVLLGAGGALPHSCLRLAVLGSGDGSSRSKCILELAVASLVEQGVVVRQGYGPLAALSVPDAALPKAEALAYSEFPDEGQLPLYSGGAAAALGRHRPAACSNRLRRLSSPRQFGHRPMAGVEKAGARRGKRGMEDISNQLHKKMRMQDGFGGGGGGGAPFGQGSLAAMSP